MAAACGASRRHRSQPPASRRQRRNDRTEGVASPSKNALLLARSSPPARLVRHWISASRLTLRVCDRATFAGPSERAAKERRWSRLAAAGTRSKPGNTRAASPQLTTPPSRARCSTSTCLFFGGDAKRGTRATYSRTTRSRRRSWRATPGKAFPTCRTSVWAGSIDSDGVSAHPSADRRLCGVQLGQRHGDERERFSGLRLRDDGPQLAEVGTVQRANALEVGAGDGEQVVGECG